MGWQPIETAPDVDVLSPVLVYSEGGNYDVAYVGWHEENKPVWFNGDVALIEVTHWMPLPDAPK